MLNHSKEFLLRMIYVGLSFFRMFLILYNYNLELFDLLFNKIDFKDFQLTGPLEMIYASIYLSFYWSLFLSLPLRYLQSVLFILPGLHMGEIPSLKALTVIFIIIWTTSFLLIFYFLPLVWKFVIYMVPNKNEFDIDVNLRLIEFVYFILNLFGLIVFLTFLPGILLFLSFIDLISRQFLSRKVFLVMSLILAAVVTPPDIVSQLLVAGFLMIIFELFQIVSCFIIRYNQASVLKIKQ